MYSILHFYIRRRRVYKTGQDGNWDGFWAFTDAISKFSLSPQCKSAHKTKFETTFTSKLLVNFNVNEVELFDP